ncbi:hypothetical protein AB0N14_39520 [Streptomyces sp. NPDC051104]|uniref:hypothetical protein n=1 Tax=Streptomyces sp. NPDC051104 TaxID=3155044 RepID=UPI0034197B83
MSRHLVRVSSTTSGWFLLAARANAIAWSRLGNRLPESISPIVLLETRWPQASVSSSSCRSDGFPPRMRTSLNQAAKP